MQGHVSELGSRGAASVKHFAREVQASGRRGNGTPMLCEDGLIAVAIRGLRRAVNVRRQGNAAQLLELGAYREQSVYGRMQADDPLSPFLFFRYFSF